MPHSGAAAGGLLHDAGDLVKGQVPGPPSSRMRPRRAVRSAGSSGSGGIWTQNWPNRYGVGFSTVSQ